MTCDCYALHDTVACHCEWKAEVARLRAELEQAKAETHSVETLRILAVAERNGLVRERNAAWAALEVAENFLENVRQYGALRSEVDVPKLFDALSAIRSARGEKQTSEASPIRPLPVLLERDDQDASEPALSNPSGETWAEDVRAKSKGLTQECAQIGRALTGVAADDLGTVVGSGDTNPNGGGGE